MRKAAEQNVKSGHNNPGFVHSSNEQINKVPMPLAAIQSLGIGQRP
jgi:hypothetical protein